MVLQRAQKYGLTKVLGVYEINLWLVHAAWGHNLRSWFDLHKPPKILVEPELNQAKPG